jgi:hypothetical protein
MEHKHHSNGKTLRRLPNIHHLSSPPGFLHLSLIPSLYFFLTHHRSSPVSIPFFRGLQLHPLPVLLHLIFSIFLHCIIVSMAEPNLQAVLPHQVAPC